MERRRIENKHIRETIDLIDAVRETYPTLTHSAKAQLLKELKEVAKKMASTTNNAIAIANSSTKGIPLGQY